MEEQNINTFKYKKLLLIIIGIILSVVIIFYGIISYFIFFQKVDKDAKPEQFTLTGNASQSDSDEIAQLLKNKGYIKNITAFKVAFLGFSGLYSRCVDCISPGAYKISKSMSTYEIAKVLKNEAYMKWVTIPEGLRKEEIAEILAKSLNWTDAEKKDWINKYTNTNSDYFEGVYFPDTYLIPSTESPEDVAKRLRAKFEEKFAPYAKEAVAQNIKWTTVIKLASIIQREAAGKSDMPIVSGVLWNRLFKDMRLEVDSTLQYARGDKGKGFWAPITVADKQTDSPYNTYKNTGLPPHPISNPGIEAIKAVLYPASTTCMYFLHDTKGEIHCSDTYDGHLQNINKYLK